jgi:hypothetical protein
MTSRQEIPPISEILQIFLNKTSAAAGNLMALQLQVDFLISVLTKEQRFSILENLQTTSNELEPVKKRSGADALVWGTFDFETNRVISEIASSLSD